jgi:4-diphosphocytidyl-2-C-methyl-D-erythritol kinase
MISFPKAKINLGLRITGKRPDGFHDIETIFYPIGLADALEFVEQCRPLAHDQLKVTGIIPDSPPDENLVMKALGKIRDKFDFPFLNIHLHKAIPSGAGLGGGSSDGACMLKALNKKYSLALSTEELKSLALELGSDCPYFIDSTPSLAKGRGEKLEPVEPKLNGLYLILLNPGIHVSTRDAYSNCKPLKPKHSLAKLWEKPFEDWRTLIKNDFEQYVFKLHPEVGELKDILYNSGAVYSSMTGSGSSVYGIFKDKPGFTAVLRKHLIWQGFL